MSVRSYRDLIVWREAMDLAVACHRLVDCFPESERYGLALQVRRAAISIPANIAEGRSRFGTREFARFVSIARGSLAELETHILLAQRLGYVESARTAPILARTAETGRMLSALHTTLKSRANRRPTPSPRP